MEVLVQTNNLTKRYGKHKAVNNVNLSVRKGEIYGLIGRNGAGKTVDKRFIFVYPFACICIRVLLSPIIYVRFLMTYIYGELTTEYLTNYLCFIALSVEIFSILSVHGLVESVVAVLLVDTIVFIGILIAGITKINLVHSPLFKK